jgi:tripartite motif-containing protein 71
MVGLKAFKRIALAGAAAAALSLTACPSPLLARIQEEIAKYPFKAASYTFVKQWGNSHPEWAFTSSAVVRGDTVGNVYVADASGRIRKFSGSGALLSVSGWASDQGFSGTIFDMAFDAGGNMYLVTNNTNQILKYDSSGNLVTSWGGAALYPPTTGTSLSSPRGIAVSGAGVYVMDTGHSRVVKFDTSGNYVIDWGGATTWGSAAVSMSSPYGIAVDNGGYIYVADRGRNRILVFSPVASTAPTISYTDWGNATLYNSYALSSPVRIALSLGATQYLYVADGGGTNNSRILKFYTYGSYITTFGSVGTADGQLRTAASSVGVDSTGYVYTADTYSGTNSSWMGRIQKWDSTSGTPWQSTWSAALNTNNGSIGVPWGVALDSGGNVYVVEYINSRVEKFDSQGNYLLQMGTAAATADQLQGPTGVAVDSAGNVLVTEFGFSRVHVFNPSGVTSNYISTILTAPGNLSGPSAVSVDSAGKVWVSDWGNQRIQAFSPTYLDAGAWAAPLYGYGMALDPKGYVYVSSLYSKSVTKFDLLGNQLAVWSSTGSPVVDFTSPMGMAVDALGNVYVADMGTHRVIKLDSSGNVIGQVGGVGVGNGGLGWPMGVAVNAEGHVWVTDYQTPLVQEFAPAQ